MQPSIHCFRVGVVLSLLAPPPTASFSRGANHASCQEMIPGHIRAHPHEPHHGYVSVRTSVSSYLPGQLVTVTIRSSRDFMGFLLQARSMDQVRGGAKGGAKVGNGNRSLGEEPVLVGGSWAVTPPGVHTLHCRSEDDTVTHSDKQLKRNLSFVWRAPDVPIGDLRFYITVVQSYFVYWANIQSAVLRDGTRSSWSTAATLAPPHEKTSLAAFSDDLGTTFEPSNKPRIGPLTDTSQQTPVSGLVMWTNRSATSVFLREASSRTGSGEEGNTIRPAKFDPSHTLTTVLPNNMAHIYRSPATVFQSSKDLPSDDPKTHLQNQTPPTNPETKDEEIQLESTNFPSTSHSKNLENSPTQTSSNPKDLIEELNRLVPRNGESSTPSRSHRSDSHTETVLLLNTLAGLQSRSGRPQIQVETLDPLGRTHRTITDTGGTQTLQSQTEVPPKGVSTFPPSRSQLGLFPVSIQSPPPATPQGFNPSLSSVSERKLNVGEDQLKRQSGTETTMSLVASVLPDSSSSAHLDSSLLRLVASSSPGTTGASSLVSTLPSFSSTTFVPSTLSSKKNQPKTAAVLPSVPSPSPISTPPYSPSVQTSRTFYAPSSVPSTSESFMTSSTSSIFTHSSSSSSSSTSLHSTSPLPGPSPALRRSPISSVSPVTTWKPAYSQRMPNQHVSRSHATLKPAASRTIVHPNPKPHPNLHPDHKPIPPNTDVQPKSPSGPPEKEGKYPDIVPRHSDWELGMLLGCSAGLGMVLVVGVRYMYRQACGKQTAVTLNDRQMDYGRGERGLIHVQECGDLVRVRKIRENSFVLLAEYDILTPPGD